MVAATPNSDIRGSARISHATWALAPLLLLGPALTCIAPRIMAALFIGSGILAIALDVHARQRWPRADIQMLTIFAALIALGFLSSLWSIAPAASLAKALQLTIVLGVTSLLVPVVSRFSQADLERVGTFLVCGLGLGLAIYSCEMLYDFQLYQLAHPGQAAVVPDIKQNKAVVLLALWTCVSFPFSFLSKQPRRRVLFVAMTAMTYYLTLTSHSASAQLIALLALPMLAIIRFLPPQFTLRTALLTTVAITLLMPVAARSMTRFVDPQYIGNPLGRSVVSRLEIWDQAARRIAERPLVGWGLNSSPGLPNRGEISILHPTIPIPISHLHPHNAPLQIWFELGAAGVAGIALFFTLMFRRINLASSSTSIKYAAFAWLTTFLYTLSIWGIWQTWFLASLCFVGVMASAGMRYINREPTLNHCPP